jgi:hypothetical protein
MDEIQAASPYAWHIAAFFWLIFVFRGMNSVKRWQCFPLSICKIKKTESGYEYKKLKVRYIDSISAVSSFIGLYFCERQLLGTTYSDQEQLLIITIIAALSSQIIIKLVIQKISESNPEMAKILADGIKEDDDLSVFHKTKNALIYGKKVKDGKTKPK